LKHRLFVAIDLPSTHKLLIAALTSTPQFQALPVIWEPPHKLHLTLNFIGSVDRETLARIQTSLQGVASRTSTFQLHLPFLETLYRRHLGSLVYLAPSGDLDQLAQLQSLLSSVIKNLAIPQPVRFLPHVMIGRLIKSDPVSTKATLSQIKDLSFTPPDPFTVSTFTLFESHLSKNGSVYRPIKYYSLSTS
jgi:2'-5' RNA ligase